MSKQTPEMLDLVLFQNMRAHRDDDEKHKEMTGVEKGLLITFLILYVVIWVLALYAVSKTKSAWSYPADITFAWMSPISYFLLRAVGLLNVSDQS